MLTKKISSNMVWQIPNSTHVHLFPDVFSLIQELLLEGITNYSVNVKQEEFKVGTLVDVMDGIQFNQVLIFCTTKRKVDWLCEELRSRNFPTSALVQIRQINPINCFQHGDMDQDSRDTVLLSFRSGSSRILVSTPSCFVGLDVPTLDCVINYDIPTSFKDFLNQVGRCGRFGRKGMRFSIHENVFTRSGRSITLYNADQKSDWETLQIARLNLPSDLATV